MWTGAEYRVGRAMIIPSSVRGMIGAANPKRRMLSATRCSLSEVSAGLGLSAQGVSWSAEIHEAAASSEACSAAVFFFLFGPLSCLLAIALVSVSHFCWLLLLACLLFSSDAADECVSLFLCFRLLFKNKKIIVIYTNI